MSDAKSMRFTKPGPRKRGMVGVSFPDTPSHVLQLVSAALDEFETVSMGGTLRRALRIAKLRGDAADAFRFALELGLSDEGVTAKMEDEGQLHPSWRMGVVQAFRENRTVKIDPKLLGHTDGTPVVYVNAIDELEVRDLTYEDELSLQSRIEHQNKRHVTNQMISTIRNLAFRYLNDCETELRISVTGERLFGRHRLRVDSVLRQSAPEVLDKLSAAIRRATESEDPEARAQALLSCRRVLEAVADVVFPAQSEPYIDGKGTERAVGPGGYRNRIIAALETNKSTHSEAERAGIEEFASRLESLDALGQKGVHSDVAQAEMEFAVVQTYLLAGEVLMITGPPQKIDEGHY